MTKLKTKHKAKVKAAKTLRGKFKFDRTWMIVSAVVLVITGYFFYQGTHAASFPPAIDVTVKSMAITTPDFTSKVANSACFTFTASTPLGPVTRCMQKQPPKNLFRMVTYFKKQQLYVPGPWITGQTDNNIHQVSFICKNGHLFSGWGPIVYPVYDPVVYYGQEYRKSGSTWQLSFTTYSGLSKNCTNTSPWYNLTSK